MTGKPPHDIAGSGQSVRLPSRRPGEIELSEIQPRLLRVAVKLVWNRHDAEEIVQEAMQLGSERNIWDELDHWQPWLFRTVSNLCLNWRRRSRAEPLKIEPMDRPHHSALETAESLTALHREIEQLPDQQRIVVVLRLMEQMAFDDIAGIMQCSVSAVRAHLSVARRTLRARLTVIRQQE